MINSLIVDLDIYRKTTLLSLIFIKSFNDSSISKSILFLFKFPDISGDIIFFLFL